MSVELILVHETHSPDEWEKKCRGMNTHYINFGTIFEDSEEEGEEEKSTNSKKGGGKVSKTKDVTRYLIKWRGLSYVHVSWETKADLLQNDPSFFPQKLKKYKSSCPSIPLSGDEYFNPEYLSVDRILEINEYVDEVDGVDRLEYYIKWNASSYHASTWEQSSDVHDDKAVERYHLFKTNKRRVGRRKERRKPTSFRAYSETNIPSFNDPSQQLRDYQLTGLNWMVFNWLNGRNCILADEVS
jgi:SNF2 family DNA or RNA helicase